MAASKRTIRGGGGCAVFRSRGWIEEDYARLDEYARKAAEGAPSLTEAQMKRLGELLRPIKAG